MISISGTLCSGKIIEDDDYFPQITEGEPAYPTSASNYRKSVRKQAPQWDEWGWWCLSFTICDSDHASEVMLLII